MPKIRLYKHLIEHLKNTGVSTYSPLETKNNIEKYGVLVDKIMIYKQLEWIYPEQNFDISTWPTREQGDTSQIQILYETKEFLVIKKPYNLTVERGIGHQKDNVVQWLWDNYPSEQKFLERYHGVQSEYNLPVSGLVHRLDKNTQGILLIAKNLQTLEFFKKQFQDRTVIKKYLAIVNGAVDKNFIVQNWQCRDKQNPTRQKLFWSESEAMEYDSTSRMAKSIIKPLLTCLQGNQTLIQIQIQTGRMHQIRLQCESLGFSLYLDKVYDQTTIFNQLEFSANTTNKMFYPISSVPTSIDSYFQQVKSGIFGAHEYCLISNELEIKLPNDSLAKFVLFDNSSEINHYTTIYDYK